MSSLNLASTSEKETGFSLRPVSLGFNLGAISPAREMNAFAIALVGSDVTTGVATSLEAESRFDAGMTVVNTV